MRSEGSTLGFKVHGKNPRLGRLGLVIEKLSKNLQLGFWNIHDLGLTWEEPSTIFIMTYIAFPS